jgi:hypothetical protein
MLLRDNGIVHPLMYLTTILAIGLMAFTEQLAVQLAGAFLLVVTVIAPIIRAWRETPTAPEMAGGRSNPVKPRRSSPDKKL